LLIFFKYHIYSDKKLLTFFVYYAILVNRFINNLIFCMNKSKYSVLSVVVIVSIFLATAVSATIIQTFKYSAEARIIVIQNFTPSTDPYIASRSNEYLSSVLAEATHSSSFFSEVLNAGYEIDSSYFPQNYAKKMKLWSRTVKVKPVADTGIIDIVVYHPDPKQADQIIQAVNHTFETRHGHYHGMGSQVDIRVIDQPVLSRYPVKPNIFLNVLLGLIFGILFAWLYIYSKSSSSDDNFGVYHNGENEKVEANFKVNNNIGHVKTTYSTDYKSNGNMNI